MASRPLLIAVCGASTATETEAGVAREVGRLLGERGAVVVCGGLGGVMAAVSEGVAEAGGTSVGLLPGDEPGSASEFVGLALPTGLGEMRNALIARMCAAMVAVGGGYGTLSEIAFMLRLGRPVCTLNSWRLIPPGQPGEDRSVHRASDAASAVEWVLSRL